MYNKILVALDGSQLAESILPYARAFAKALNIPVELLEVIDPDTLIPSVAAQHGYPHTLLTAERAHNGEYLKDIAASFSNPAAVSCSVRIGKPAEVIIEVAAAHADTLIAMATHGRSGIKRWLLGSVAEKVLHGANDDLLLVRSAEQVGSRKVALPKRILVPLDGSKLAETALSCGVDLAKEMSLELVLLRVYLMPGVAYLTGSHAPDWELLDKEIREQASKYLQERMRQLKDDGLERVSFVVLEGSAAEKIVDLAREKPGSLIVMSTHGMSGMGRWVLGSITERVARHSGEPVLIVRATRERSAS